MREGDRLRLRPFDHGFRGWPLFVNYGRRNELRTRDFFHGVFPHHRLFNYALLHYRLLVRRLLHHGLLSDGPLDGAMLGGKGWRIFPRNGDGSILALAR